MRTLQRADWLSVLVVASISAWFLVRRRRQRSRTSDAATSYAGGNTIEVAELACAELGAIDQAWAAVVPDAMAVEDCTSQIGAMGGVQTYRMSASVAEGRVMKAVLRQWSGSQETAVEQRLFVQRWCAACRVFALHGVGPRRLAEQPLRPRRLAEQGRADGWAVEEWPGTALHTVPSPLASGATTASWSGLDARTARAAGQLLARAHQVPTTWFEGFREAYQTCLPWLRGTARGSNAWVYASLAPGGLLCCDSSLRVLWADGSTAAPRHPVSARLVTTHGNFHPGNIVRPAAYARPAAYVERGGGSAAAEEGEEEDEELLRLVDFDCSCVAAAIFDLASAFALDESGHFDCFLAGYLDQLGGAWSSADLEAIRLDAALASRRIQSGLEAIRLALVEATVPPVPVHSTSSAKAKATAADFAAAKAKAAAAAAAEAAAADAAATTVATAGLDERASAFIAEIETEVAMADLDERANSFIAEMETEVAEEASRSASRAAMEAVLEAELEEEELQEEELEEEELEEQLEEDELEVEQLGAQLEEQQLEEQQLEEQQLEEQQLEEEQLEEQQLEQEQQLGGKQLEQQLEEQQLEEQQLLQSAYNAQRAFILTAEAQQLEEQLEEEQPGGQLEEQQLEAEAAVALAAAEEARAAAERAAERAAAAVEKLQAARQTQTPDPPAEIPDSSLAIPERSAAVVCSTVSTEAAEHPFLGLSPSDSLGSLESLGSLGSLGSQPPPRPISRAESGSSLDRPLSAQEAKEANRARRNSVAAQDWAIKRRQQMERAARIKGERAFSGRPSSATSSTGTPRRSPAVPAAATATSPPYSPATVSPKPARVASHGANPVPRAASRSLSGALQAAAPPLEPQQPQTPPPPPPQLTSRRRSSPAEHVIALRDEDASNGSSSHTPLASSRPVGSPSTTTVPSPRRAPPSTTGELDDRRGWRGRHAPNRHAQYGLPQQNSLACTYRYPA